jgi:hypothetical protein|tara:strand:+ start:14740 stop:16203 length:1464 start_codon:yes stop_codon:yes gene_type:complete
MSVAALWMSDAIRFVPRIRVPRVARARAFDDSSDARDAKFDRASLAARARRVATRRRGSRASRSAAAGEASAHRDAARATPRDASREGATRGRGATHRASDAPDEDDLAMKTTRGRARVRRMPAGRIRRRAARALSIACALALGRDGVTRAEAQASDGNCVAAEQTAIFVAFSENAPDAVFRSDDGCLAGGGRGVGCCPGSVCKACEGDSTSRFYSCKCEPCAAGTVQPLAAQKTCVSCPAGWFNSRTGQATCEPCPVGTFSTKVGNTVGCTACGAGTSGKSTLEDYYEKTTRSWRAPATGDGSTFDSTLAATSCTDCPAGTSGGGAGDACTPCAPGYYSAARAETCTPCPVGTYSVLSGGASIDSCIPCAAGESNNAIGSTECWQVCPIALLSCAADAVRARGAYDALELARARPRISYTDDGIDDYRARLCKTGCETFATDHWCASFGLPNVNDCDQYAPPPPPPAPPGDVADPNATAANASAAS